MRGARFKSLLLRAACASCESIDWLQGATGRERIVQFVNGNVVAGEWSQISAGGNPFLVCRKCSHRLFFDGLPAERISHLLDRIEAINELVENVPKPQTRSDAVELKTEAPQEQTKQTSLKFIVAPVYDHDLRYPIDVQIGVDGDNAEALVINRSALRLRGELALAIPRSYEAALDYETSRQAAKGALLTCESNEFHPYGLDTMVRIFSAIHEIDPSVLTTGVFERDCNVKDIAEKSGLDPSTITRVCSWLAIEFVSGEVGNISEMFGEKTGIYLGKGKTHSTSDVANLISDILKRFEIRPSDSAISQMLEAEYGIKAARRTVNKMRNQLSTSSPVESPEVTAENWAELAPYERRLLLREKVKGMQFIPK